MVVMRILGHYLFLLFSVSLGRYLHWKATMSLLPDECCVVLSKSPPASHSFFFFFSPARMLTAHRPQLSHTVRMAYI